MADKFIITFPEITDAEANRYASDLAHVLTEADKGLHVEQSRNRIGTQDFGTTLVLVLGTASVTAIARGIQAFLKR